VHEYRRRWFTNYAYQPVVGNIIDRIDKFNGIWTVQFDLKISGPALSSHASVIHLTTGTDAQRPGDRNPSVFVQPGGSQLHISAYVNGNNNYHFTTPNHLSLDIWHTIILQQQIENGLLMYAIIIDDTVILSVENVTPLTVYNTIVYGGDPWWIAPNAVIKNLEIVTRPLICKNLLTSNA